ncbi:MAG: 2-octaprenyl-6-methoxyphenyl hydroxylase [Gammaproteobacteria bacterium]|nr:2-octaprenyl-6-methoxyphenyl hydroxylase [Gammaproteobacteria bacterium]
MNAQKSQTDYDLVIAGGGMVGASLACALGNQPLRIAMIEAHNQKLDTPPSYDDRAIALSWGTSQIFRALGLWERLAVKSTAIKQIHVSDRGHFGVTRIDNQEEHVEALGYVITARDLGQVLYGALSQYSNLTILKPAQLTDLAFTDTEAHATITVNHGTNDATREDCSSKLIVAADGGGSSVRQLLNIDTRQYDYRQTAITANVSVSRPHNNVAFERFTAQGPLALLPMEGNRCSLAWTRQNKVADSILALSDEEFLRQLQREFGNRLGRFTRVGQRSAYPLQLLKASAQVMKRVALIGNAAHTLHPIAGQGFNLGMRDVAALAQIVIEQHTAGRDIGLLQALQPYQQWRQRDHQSIIGFTDSLVKIFSNRFAPLALARNLGLIATDIIPPLKHTLAQYTMGMAGKLPRLARGLPLQ